MFTISKIGNSKAFCQVNTILPDTLHFIQPNLHSALKSLCLSHITAKTSPLLFIFCAILFCLLSLQLFFRPAGCTFNLSAVCSFFLWPSVNLNVLFHTNSKQVWNYICRVLCGAIYLFIDLTIVCVGGYTYNSRPHCYFNAGAFSDLQTSAS